MLLFIEAKEVVIDEIKRFLSEAYKRFKLKALRREK